MPSLPSLGLLREKLKKAKATIESTAGVLTTDDCISLFYSPEQGEVERQISQDEFFADNPPPGLYRVLVTAVEDGETRELLNITGANYVGLTRGEGVSSGGIARDASILTATAASEVVRMEKRLITWEERCDRMQREKEDLQAAIAELRREVSRLEAELEDSDDDGSMGELAQMIGQLICTVLGVDDAPKAEAVTVIVNAAKESKTVQKALEKAGAGPALRLLTEGQDT